MNVTVEYAAQVKRAAGLASERLEVDESSCVQDVVRRIAQDHGDPLSSLLLGSDDQLHPSILLFVRDEQVRWETPVPLSENDVVTILSPISGG